MNLSEREQEEVIKGCIKGDRKSQQKVYEAYYGKMMAVCFRYARDRDEAKDILQDGFIKVFTNIKKYNSAGSFEGWIRRIIVNTAIDSFRKNRNSYLLSEDDNTIDNLQNEPEEEEDEKPFGGLKTENVVQAMQQLSPAYRTVFNLYVVENYSHKEIAEILGISTGTSKSNLAKAKQNLKKILEQDFIRNNGE